MAVFSAHVAELAVSFNGGSTYTKIPKMRSFTMGRSAEEIDASNNDSGGWKEKLNGRKEWTMSGEYLQQDAADTVHDGIEDAWENDTTIKVRVRPKTGAGLKQFIGDAVVGKCDADFGDNAAAKVSFEFRMRGALAKSTQ